MKRVLILNGDTFVGIHVAKTFFHTKEYEVSVTLCKRKDEHVSREKVKAGKKDKKNSSSNHHHHHNVHDDSSAAVLGDNEDTVLLVQTAIDLPVNGTQSKAAPLTIKEMLAQVREAEADQHAHVRSPSHPSSDARTVLMPAALAPFVHHAIPSHNDDPAAFCRLLLEHDVIVAVLQGDEDTYEAECAIKVLLGSHYNVEKTFVLLSSLLTWSYTAVAARARARAAKREALEKELQEFLEENGEEEPLPAHLRDLDSKYPRVPPPPSAPLLGQAEAPAVAPSADTNSSASAAAAAAAAAATELLLGVDKYDEAALAPRKVFTEDDYAERVPHPRYQQWKLLEHLVKHANSGSLHTYVVFAGVPYGRGEGPLQALLRDAQAQRPLHLYGNGDNVIPMIHVDDLAAILFQLGDSFAVRDRRYWIAVDRGQVTQRQLLEVLATQLGGYVRPAPLPPSAAAANAPRGAYYYVHEGHVHFADTANAITAEADRPETSVDMVHIQEATRTPSLTQLQLQYLFREATTALPSYVLDYFLSDLQAEPGEVLEIHPEENWTSVDGFVDAIDKVLFDFRKELSSGGSSYTLGGSGAIGSVQPFRAVVAGPPLSGKEAMAASLAQLYDAPLLTLPGMTAAYEQHAREVRAELHELLVRRLQRRRDRAAARRKRGRLAEKAEKAKAAAEAALAKKDEDDEDEEEEEDGRPSQEKPAGAEDNADQLSSVSELSEDFGPVAAAGDDAEQLQQGQREAAAPAQRRYKAPEEVVNERYLLGYAAADDPPPEGEDDNAAGGHGDDEELDEEVEEEDTEDVLLEGDEDAEEEEEGEDGEPAAPRVTHAHRQARELIRELDSSERVRIKQLRGEYRLARRVLSMKQMLPRRKEEEDEEEEEAGQQQRAESEAAAARKRRPHDEDEEDEEGEEREEEDEGGETRDHAESGKAEGSEDAAADTVEAILAQHAAKQAAAREVQQQQQPQASGEIVSAPPEAYMDEALAFFARWRMRHADCRNKGYVLLNFPNTVRQALLLFHCDEEEENENADGGDAAAATGADFANEKRKQRRLPPRQVADVPPPYDAHFPFLHWSDLSNEDRAVLEEFILKKHNLPLVTFEEGAAAAEKSAPTAKSLVDKKMQWLQQHPRLLERLRASNKARSGKKDKSQQPRDAEATGGAGDRPEDDDEDEKEGDGEEQEEVDPAAVLCPVSEEKFPQYVIIIQDSDKVLQTRAGVLLAQYNNHYTSSATGTAAEAASTATVTKPGAARGALSAAHANGGLPIALQGFYENLQQYKKHFAFPSHGDPSAALAGSSVAPLKNANLFSHSTMNGGGSGFPGADDARAATSALPTRSLPSWYQTVMTAPAVGATTARARVAYEPLFAAAALEGDDADQGKGAAAAEEEEVLGGGWPLTRRAANCLVLKSPPRSATDLQNEVEWWEQTRLAAAAIAALQQQQRDARPRMEDHYFNLGTDGPTMATALLRQAVLRNDVAPLLLLPSAVSNTAAAAASNNSTTSNSSTTNNLNNTSKMYDQGLAAAIGSCATVPSMWAASQSPITAFRDLVLSLVETGSLPTPRPLGPVYTSDPLSLLSAQGPRAGGGARGSISSVNNNNNTSNRSGLNTAEAQDEVSRLRQLMMQEDELLQEVRTSEEAEIQNERRRLRAVQMGEDVMPHLGSLVGMPTEKYLMEYVLPSLTPLMAEVVRQRPEAPVTVLADLLFHYKRPTSL